MAKKKVEGNESGICMPGNGSKDWVHTALAAVILLFAFMSGSWAQWIVVLAAAVIFISGVIACCKACKK
mgnify:CR=1 FL=1